MEDTIINDDIIDDDDDGGDDDDDDDDFSFVMPQAAAIVYMFVEPEFRSRGLGSLALEVIAWIQASQGIDYTVLVADDKTPGMLERSKQAGKLVQWYQRHGFATAPLLQDLFGSPHGQFGITMIRPTHPSVINHNNSNPEDWNDSDNPPRFTLQW